MLFIAGHGAFSNANPMPGLTVDIAHGGCRLTVLKDGRASIGYGAMPRQVRVTPGTFNFDELLDLLRAKSYPQSDRSVRDEKTGTVLLPDLEELRLINDLALVRSLLERAWQAREEPEPPFATEEDRQWIARACAFSL